jgi:molybdenum cofactor cytidylyltransferase
MVYNNEWKEGVSSSVRAGLKELVSLNPGADAAIFMVCDQPLVTYELLDNLMTTHYKTGKPIITSAVDDDPCPPALFHQSIFPELLQLTGDHGARKIIEIHAGNLVKVPFAGGKVDIDTEADYRALI